MLYNVYIYFSSIFSFFIKKIVSQPHSRSNFLPFSYSEKMCRGRGCVFLSFSFIIIIFFSWSIKFLQQNINHLLNGFGSHRIEDSGYNFCNGKVIWIKFTNIFNHLEQIYCSNCRGCVEVLCQILDSTG